MLETINSPTLNVPTAEINFSWSPVDAPFTFTIGSTTYAPGDFQTPTGSPITFLASVVFPTMTEDPLVAVEYRWDFGDGVVGYGSSAVHTFKFANPHLRVALRVTDNKGRRYFVSHPLHLVTSNLSVVVVNKGIVVFGDAPPVFDGEEAYYL